MRIAAVLSGLGALLVVEAVAATGDPLVVTGDVVNVRRGPGTNYGVLVQVYQGDTAVELAREGEWLQVELAVQPEPGWIHQSLLAPMAGPAPADTAAPSPEGTAPAAADAPTPEPPAPADVAAPADRPPPDAPAADAPTSELPAPSDAASPGDLPATDPAAAGAPSADVAAPADQPLRDTALAVPSEADGAMAGAAPGGEPEDALVRFGDTVSALNARAVEVAGIDLFVGVEPVDDTTVRVLATEAWATVPEAGQRSYMNTLLGQWQAAAGGAGPVRVQVIAPEGDVAREATGP